MTAQATTEISADRTERTSGADLGGALPPVQSRQRAPAGPPHPGGGLPAHLKLCARCDRAFPRCSGFSRWSKVCRRCEAVEEPAPNKKPNLTKRETDLIAMRNDLGLSDAQIGNRLRMDSTRVAELVSELRRRGAQVLTEDEVTRYSPTAPQGSGRRARARRTQASRGAVLV